MTLQQREYFLALSESRSKDADSLDRPNMRGVKRSITDKYSDPAHFVYELIQNADDAKAKSASFELFPDRVIFRHDGTRRFLVSNPDNEEYDYDNQRLGDINAITGIGFSSKPEENRKGNTIGKFGLGFKSIFQYTHSPEIYDPDVAFRIDRIIVPRLLDKDWDGRKPDETVFVFPFDNKEAFNPEGVIAAKFKALLLPTLFLNNLEKVSYKYGSEAGEYSKKILEHYDWILNNVPLTCDLIDYSQKTSSGESHVSLWLFGRTDDANHKFSVGYVTDGEGHLVPAQYKAFCFFPTKHETGLKFIIHAPFLLTDSREGIKSDAPHNADMVHKLADLSYDSFIVLREIGEKTGRRFIEDSIVDILPVAIQDYTDTLDFNPFYRRILNLFVGERILPSLDGCIYGRNAYWPESQQQVAVFSPSQLKLLYHNSEASWVFPNRWYGGRYQKGSDSGSYSFIERVVGNRVSELSILDVITAGFIESQSREWLPKLYKWLNGDAERRNKAKRLPIFLNQNGKACAAFDKEGRHILFLPVETESHQETVLQDLLGDESVQALIREYEIKEPDMVDHARWLIQKKLPQAEGSEYDEIWRFLLKYYCSLPPSDRNEFSNELKEAPPRLWSHNCKTGEVSLLAPSTLYFETEDLKRFFCYCGAVAFVDEQHYQGLVGEKFRDDIRELLGSLGVASIPRLKNVELSHSEAYAIKGTKWAYSTGFDKWTEPQIDGLPEAFKALDVEFDVAVQKELSLVIWKTLAALAKSCEVTSVWGAYYGLERKLRGSHEYFYRTGRSEPFDSRNLTLMKNSAWVFSVSGEMCVPGELTKQSIAPAYKSVPGCELLFSLLNIKDPPIENSELSSFELARQNLSDDDKKDLELGRAARAAGYTKEQVDAIAAENARLKEEIRQRDLADAKTAKTKVQNDDGQASSSEDEAEPDNISEPSLEKNVHVIEHHRTSPTRGSVVDRIMSGIEDFKKQYDSSGSPPPPLPDPYAEAEDDDEQLPRSIDFAKKIQASEQKEARAIAELERGSRLQNEAAQAEKYTFGWFKKLLELELLGKEKESAERREITICFTKIDREPGTEKTFVLKRPSRNLPQWLEDLTGIPLDIVVGNRTLSPSPVIEVMSVQSFNLRVKLKTAKALEGVNLDDVVEVRFAAKNPDFILAALRQGLQALPFEDSKNLKTDITENIEFIFGPPGTGKTTFLSEKRILTLMRRPQGCRVLVLTPTNKAADVLSRRVIERMSGDDSYKNWLVRFGATGDEELERSGVCPGKDIDLTGLTRCTVVTTIARFPYDFCLPGNAPKQNLVDLKWDYIVVDEASMIPLVNIIYPLYKKPEAHFIVAGDPFQIEPIIACELWKDENIYKMVELNDFANPHTCRNHPVTKLTTQYRSIPSVGRIFSEYRYKGILAHARKEDSFRSLEVPNFIDIRPLTLLKFPVSPYESIYRLKRLGLNGGSSYQIYSALFAFEFVCSIAKKMLPQSEKFRIGVISPYRAQADMVQRLVDSVALPDFIQISAGTVHGFQGDECEMIIALFNPPPGISGKKGSFINKKNIINVAISRARDYLVMIMPNDHTQDLENMVEVRKVEALMRQDAANVIIHSTGSVEAAMFGAEDYIEANTFSTGHQTVNVYGVPEKRYEIRTDDTAVDVQLHINKQTEKKSDITREEDGEQEPLPPAEMGIQEVANDESENVVDGFLRLVKVKFPDGLSFSEEEIRTLERSYCKRMSSEIRLQMEKQLFRRSDGLWFHPESITPKEDQELLVERFRNGSAGLMPIAFNECLKEYMRGLEEPQDLRGFFRMIKSIQH